MTYLEYVKIVCPESVREDGYVRGCPETHDLPPVSCSATCVACYASNEVPADMVESLFMEPVDVKDLMKMIGGVS